MIKMITVIGARPQIIKAAAISRAVRENFSEQIEEILVHSGQHYDSNMSRVFFEEMEIPKEKYNLNVGSGSHASQTAKIMTGVEQILIEEKPNILLLYGDTNSTLAAALVASKLNIPIVHIEGGVRNQTKDYPEEINRILTDNLSSIIFVPSQDGMECLKKEGFNLENKENATKDNPVVLHTGDIMYDNACYFGSKTSGTFIDALGLNTSEFILLTMHRHNLSENDSYVKEVFEAMNHIAEKDKVSVVFPIHPRIKNQVIDLGLMEGLHPNIKLIDPVSFIEMIELEKESKLIITDSGGVQKEAYFFEKPCLILLEYTPWIELIESGTALLCGYSKERIINNYFELKENSESLDFPKLYGDGKTSQYICEQILKSFNYD